MTKIKSMISLLLRKGKSILFEMVLPYNLRQLVASVEIRQRDLVLESARKNSEMYLAV